MFPMNEHCHWFLCVFQPCESLIYILDPYVKEDNKESILEKHLNSLGKLEQEFLKPHFEKKKSLEMDDLVKTVILPPFIPEQDDGSNCGIFMLEFAR